MAVLLWGVSMPLGTQASDFICLVLVRSTACVTSDPLPPPPLSDVPPWPELIDLGSGVGGGGKSHHGSKVTALRVSPRLDICHPHPRGLPGLRWTFPPQPQRGDADEVGSAYTAAQPWTRSPNGHLGQTPGLSLWVAMLTSVCWGRRGRLDALGRGQPSSGLGSGRLWSPFLAIASLSSNDNPLLLPMVAIT